MDDLVSFLRFCYFFSMDIGIRLRELRTAKGLSQGDIQKRTGCLRCYTSRVENGHTVPSLETLEKYAGALEIELYQLFFAGKGKPRPAGSGDAGTLGPEERGLIDAFKKLDKRNRKFVVEMTRKMAKGS
jgi:transcriptional regulator with XRE-family HTH domain